MLHSHNEIQRKRPVAKSYAKGNQTNTLKAAKVSTEVSATVVSIIVIEYFAQQQPTSETTKQRKAHTHPATWSSAVGSIPTTVRGTHDHRTVAGLGLVGVGLLASHGHLLNTLSLRFHTKTILCKESASDSSHQ